MTRQEREANPGESFDGGYHLYAGTGKIVGYDSLRGIHNLIKICEGEV